MPKRSDLSTLFGIIISLALIIASVNMSGHSANSSYFDFSSALIVFGGTAFVTIACFSAKDFAEAIKISGRTLFYSRDDFRNAATNCIKVADIAKKQGILGLQNHYNLFNYNPFFFKGINFIIDAIPEAQVEKALENEIYSISTANKKTVDLLRKAADVAPAMGLIGTLIGLVQMLGSMEDPTKIGPSMALAILTTLYGAVLSYMVLLPLATKLEKNSKEEFILIKLYSETIMSIARQESPRRLEMQLNAILQPKDKMTIY